jgi:hypothetical protein
MGDLKGTYFYSDYCSSFIRSLRTDSTCAVSPFLLRTTDLAPGGGLNIASINSYGEDARGEIYLVDQAGEIFKIVPVLRLFEVSAKNATSFLLSRGGPWTWEDLQASSSWPIALYRVYRALVPAGPFACVRQSTTPSWATGDPASPAPGQAYFYLVTARNAAGQETRGGAGLERNSAQRRHRLDLPALSSGPSWRAPQNRGPARLS